MVIREAFRAGSFYPVDEQSCRRQIEECLASYHPSPQPERVVAGLVPHAGWMFSGPTAAKVFQSIKDKSAPDIFIIFGAVHVWGVGQKAAIFAEGAWQTPCGKIPIAEDLGAKILSTAADVVIADSSAHSREHSIEVQVPFIQYLFPEAKILPIMVAPDLLAVETGQQIGKIAAEYDEAVMVLGSTDLTHYGPSFGFTPFGIGNDALASMKKNDRRILDLAAEMRADAVILDAEEHRSACGAGAIAATVAAAKELGATKGYLLEQTTSQDVMPEHRASDFVGYGGMVFGG